jgi:hypothetical protein
MAYLAASYGALLMVAARTVIIHGGSLTDQLFGSILAVLVTMTCVYDAAVLRRPWAYGVRLPFLIFWPLAVPLYVVRSRGWRGCAVVLIHGSVLIAILIAFGIIAVVVGAVA